MNTNLGKCGCNCAECPSYKVNLKTINDRNKCSTGWEKYIGIKLSPQKLRACDGCSIPDSNRKTYYLNCKIRKCAMINGLENCAYCSAFPCDELQSAHSLQKISSRGEYINKTGKRISEKDYKLFIEPYTGLFRLNKIRKNLSKKDYKDYKRFSVKNKFAPLPADLKNLKLIYTFLTSVYIEQNIPYAKLQTLESKREQLLKILWTILLYGNEKSGCYLELDAKTFLSHKIGGMYNKLLENFHELKKYGIYCQIVPLVENGWLTPLGGLRKEGWFIKLTFGEQPDGIKELKAFKEYVLRLYKKYGKKAFRYFNTADLGVMTN
jgi:hypothetical protein